MCRVRRTTRSDGWAVEAVHGHSLWIEPCECREGRKHSTEAAVSGRSLSRTGHQPTARRPPRQTSLQHEVVSSTVIRPCSREHLPGTLQLVLLPLVHTYTPSLTCRPSRFLVGREPAALGQAIQNALARAIEGTLLIVIILVARFVPVGFVLVSAIFPSIFFPLPSPRPTAYTRISCLIPVPRASLFPLCSALTPLSSLQVSVSQSGLPDLDIPP